MSCLPSLAGRMDVGNRGEGALLRVAGSSLGVHHSDSPLALPQLPGGKSSSGMCLGYCLPWPPYLMSSSLAKMMMALALDVSSRRLMILSNSPVLGSRGIFTDWAMHTPPVERPCPSA